MDLEVGNPCSPYSTVTLVATALLISINILATVLQFQSRQNTHTGHCYVMSFAASKHLDVIITIMKTVKLCNVMFRLPQVCKKWGVGNFFARYARKIVLATCKIVVPTLLGWDRKSKICVQPTNGWERGAAKSNLAPPPKKHAPRLGTWQRILLPGCRIYQIQILYWISWSFATMQCENFNSEPKIFHWPITDEKWANIREKH